MKGATVVTVLRRMGNSPPATERTFRTATERRSIPQAIRARLEAIHERRAIAGRMTAGVAAYSDSDMFKDSQSTNIAKAKRWDGMLLTLTYPPTSNSPPSQVTSQKNAWPGTLAS